MEKYKYFIAICVMLLSSLTISFAQEKLAKITLTFTKVDTTNVCNALVTSEGLPVKEVSVNLFVKRLFKPLPLGAATTDENGTASFTVPTDIPSLDGKLTFIARITDDENYINTEVSGDANLGTIVVSDNSNIDERSIYAGRDKAPKYFIAASIIIISLVWGTLLYAILQVIKIKKLSTANKLKTKTK